MAFCQMRFCLKSKQWSTNWFEFLKMAPSRYKSCMPVGCILFRNGYQLASGTGTLPIFASKVGGVVLKPQSEQAKEKPGAGKNRQHCSHDKPAYLSRDTGPLVQVLHFCF